MGRRLGLIIGVNHYQDRAFRPLQFAETDARALAQWLVNAQGGNWVPSDVQLVLGTQATHRLVESLVTQTCMNVAEKGDLVLIYFAGHAFLDETNGAGHLALINTSHQQPTTALHLLSLVRFAIGPSRATHVVVILDCFQNSQVWSMKRASPYDSKPLLGPTLLNSLQQGTDRMLLCSCRGNELAPEVGERNLGLLAYRMIVGLGGSASDPVTGQITLQRLHPFLFNELDEQHRPQLFGRWQSQVILVGDMDSTLHPPFPNGQSAPNFPYAVPNIAKVQAAQRGAQMAQGMSTTAQLSAKMAPTTSDQLALFATTQPRQQQSAMLLNRAQQLVQMQNEEEAFQLVEQVLETEPDNVTALTLKAQLLGMVGRFQEAMISVERLIRIDEDNALAWSMRAALLTNMGQFLDALPAAERAIELEPNNLETHAIKDTIMANLTPTRGSFDTSQQAATATTASRRGGRLSFVIAVGLQVFGLLLGVVGAGLPVLRPSLPIMVALGLESLGLAVLCVNAARGSYLYGAARLLLAFLTSAIVLGMLGGIYFYKSAYNRLIQIVIDHPVWLGPLLFLAFWLAAAAALPLLLAVGGFIGGVIRGVRKRR